MPKKAKKKYKILCRVGDTEKTVAFIWAYSKKQALATLRYRVRTKGFKGILFKEAFLSDLIHSTLRATEVEIE